MKTLKKTGAAVAVAAVLAVNTVAAFDFQTNYSSDDVQFKKELIYQLSKAEDLMRTFRAEGLTPSVKDAILKDDGMLYVLQNEVRYQELWTALSAENEEAEDTVNGEAADELE